MHHPIDNLCYTSHGALAGTRNSWMGPPWRIDPTTNRIMSGRSTTELHLSPSFKYWSQRYGVTRHSLTNHNTMQQQLYDYTFKHVPVLQSIGKRTYSRFTRLSKSSIHVIWLSYRSSSLRVDRVDKHSIFFNRFCRKHNVCEKQKYLLKPSTHNSISSHMGHLLTDSF